MNQQQPFTATLIATVLALPFAMSGAAQTATPAQSEQPASRPAVHSHRPLVREEGSPTPSLCAGCVRDNLTYLAGPALHGRGSGTEDEHRTAQFIAGKLKLYGLLPAAGDGQFIQTATLPSREVIGAPTLSVEANGDGRQTPLVLTHGKQIVMTGISQSPVSAPLRKLDLSNQSVSPAEFADGSALLVMLKPGTTTDESRKILEPYRNGKAALVIVASSSASQRMFDRLAKQPPRMPEQVGDREPKLRAALILANQETFDQLWGEPDGATVTLKAEFTPWKTTHTWNVLGSIEGTTEKDQIVLLSAHLDHLGVEDGKTYYGADDDASGTAAVMELARVLAREPQPKRTVVVALWGSEEAGMVGSRYFLQNPTFPLKNIVANLEFEMIGRPDDKVKPYELWLTGWERTDLGPELVQHGANLVGDPHPAEKFFSRSDNYPLAKEGIVAQTVSSYGLHKDYHQTTDTVDKIDFQHMDRAIASMIGPVTWLANSDFKPKWVASEKP